MRWVGRAKHVHDYRNRSLRGAGPSKAAAAFFALATVVTTAPSALLLSLYEGDRPVRCGPGRDRAGDLRTPLCRNVLAWDQRSCRRR